MNIKDFILGYLIGKQDGGGGSGVDVEPLTVTENGEYSEEGVAYSPVTVNVSGGGGGLEYEMGTWSPSADTNHGSILFTNQHSAAPCFFAVADIDASVPADSSATAITYYDLYKISQAGIPYYNTSRRYSLLYYAYMSGTSGQCAANFTGKNSDDVGDSTTNYPRFFCTETELKPYCYQDSKLWRAGRTYKWIAVWAPTA